MCKLIIGDFNPASVTATPLTQDEIANARLVRIGKKLISTPISKLAATLPLLGDVAIPSSLEQLKGNLSLLDLPTITAIEESLNLLPSNNISRKLSNLEIAALDKATEFIDKLSEVAIIPVEPDKRQSYIDVCIQQIITATNLNHRDIAAKVFKDFFEDNDQEEQLANFTINDNSMNANRTQDCYFDVYVESGFAGKRLLYSLGFNQSAEFFVVLEHQDSDGLPFITIDGESTKDMNDADLKAAKANAQANIAPLLEKLQASGIEVNFS